MAINTLVTGNWFIIDEGSSNQRYFNAQRTDMEFTNEAVVFTDLGKDGIRGESVTIPFTEFQYNSSAYTDEDAIFGVLNTLIG